MDFLEFRSWFDERFLQLVEKKIKLFSAHSTDIEVATITSYIYSVANGGKRFRPFLIACAMGEPLDHEKQFQLYASVELLHLFALIHDDIMDKADTRHGVVSIHTKFTPLYGVHTAQSIAILLGDIVFAWAYEEFMTYIKEFPQYSSRLIEVFQTLVSEVTHGQLLDVISPMSAPFSKELIVQKMTLKTARYSFVQPLRLGFIAKGDIAEDSVFAESFGLPLGIAFQIQDDLIDTFPTTETGKSRFTDIQTKQQTLLSWYMFEHTSLEYKEAFGKLYGTVLSEDQEGILEALIGESGAKEFLLKEIASYMEKSRQALATRSIEEQVLWQSVISLIEQRKK